MTTNTKFTTTRVHRFFLPLVFALGMSSLSGPSLAGVDCEDWPDISFYSATVTDVERCLSAGADVNARSEHGFMPLHAAVFDDASPAVVLALIDAGADVNAIGTYRTARDEFSWTPLLIAVRFDAGPAVVQALIDAGADVNARDEFGWTPLDEAVDNDADPAVVQVLKDAGAQ